jgi:hypothetical protein
VSYIYKSIDTLPIWNYDKINETNDLKYLQKDWEDIISTGLLEVWEAIKIEVNKFNNNGSYSVHDLAAVRILNNRAKLTALQNSLVLLCKIEHKETIEYVISQYPRFEYTLEGITYLKNQIEGFKQKCSLDEAKYDSKYRKEKSEPVSLYKTIEVLEDWKKRSIDPMTLTVKSYLQYCKSFQEYIKIQKNGRR